MPDKPPNVLFLMSDEHRPDVTGYEGNGVVRTPTLDWLAEGGVVFRNAYTPSPICVPGRQSLMAGQLPRTSGCERFGEDLPPFSMTFAKRFAQHAYKTVCIGKLHHEGPEQMQGWTKRPFGDMDVRPSLVDGRIDAEFDRYRPESGTGKWTNQKEIERAVGLPGRYQHFDELALAAADTFLRNHFVDPGYDRPGRHQPLLLKFSLLQPHYPFFTDAARFEYYMNRVPLFVNEPRLDHPVLRRTQAGPDVEAAPRDVRRATAAYYGMVETIDDHYGCVLNMLDHVGEDLDEWVIVYCSDHGDMLGEHGIWEKTQFFEASARVPLIIRWPRRFAPRVVYENVNLCDLFATLCDLVGVAPPDEGDTVNGRGLDSRSLVPLMDGDATEWHERHHNETISQCHATDLMIRRDAIKYLSFDRDGCPNGAEVIFDLEADPGETRNLIDEPRYAEMLPAFRRRRAALGFGPDADANYRNAGYGR